MIRCRLVLILFLWVIDCIIEVVGSFFSSCVCLVLDNGLVIVIDSLLGVFEGSGSSCYCMYVFIGSGNCLFCRYVMLIIVCGRLFWKVMVLVSVLLFNYFCEIRMWLSGC